MYKYPLRFKVDSYPLDADLGILDAEKNEILFLPKPGEEMKAGSSPYIIYSDKVARQPLYAVLRQEQGEQVTYLIKTPGDVLLGKLISEAKSAWKVLDAQESLLANIYEKASWKNSCLFTILSLPFSDSASDELLKAIAPHRYLVTLNGTQVLELREIVTAFNDDFSLKKKGEFTEREEALMVVSLMMLMY
jgi:hypothetical protein